MLLASTAAFAQPQAYYGPEALKTDLRAFRQAVLQAHADPFRYQSQASVTAAFDRAERELADGRGMLDLEDALHPVLRALGDAHTRLIWPRSETMRFASDVPLLPMMVGISNGALYVRKGLDAAAMVRPGSRIDSINGTDGATIIARLMREVVGDGADATYEHRRIEASFPELFWRYMDRTSTAFEVVWTAPTGEQHRHIFGGISLNAREKEMGVNEREAPWRTTWYPRMNAMWVHFNTMEPAALTQAGVVPEAFVADLQIQIEQKNIRNLVLDVRGAGGYDLGVCEMIFALIAQHPYRAVQDISLRSLAKPKVDAVVEVPPRFYGVVGSNFIERPDGFLHLRPDDPRLDYLPPTPGAYDGRVFVLQDGATTEAAAALSMLAKRHGRATIVGEETGTNASGYCGGEFLRVTGPATGMVLEVPLVRYTMEGPLPGPADRGELPDYQLEPQPMAYAKGKDTMMEAMLALIQELP
jgi:Peptidase family S41